MKEKHMSFGEYIKKKRLAAPGDLTLQDVADHLGVSASYVSAVENHTKRPFDGEMLGRLAEFLHLSEEETALMYDIAGRETHEVPYDIEDTFFHDPFGDLVRQVIRFYQQGIIQEEDMTACIHKMEERKEQRKK